jgi:hypothetical protein
LLCGNIAPLAQLREAQPDAVDVALEHGGDAPSPSSDHYNKALALPDQLLLLDDVWLWGRLLIHGDEDIGVKKAAKVNRDFSLRWKFERSLPEEGSSDKSADRCHLDEIRPLPRP